jgi:hypothetical protein
MTKLQQQVSRERVATALGVDPFSKEISLLSTLLGGLSGVSVRDSSIKITLPEHVVPADVELTLKDLRGITLSGNKTTVVATRADARESDALVSLANVRLPPTPPRPPEVDSTEAPPARSQKTLNPRPIDPRVRTRASQLLEALHMSLAEVPNYLGVIAVLEKASGFIVRETKNTRSDGCIFISVETQENACAILEGLGFTRASAKNGNLWAGLSYHRVCHHSETKASASIALTTRGCDITIEYGEPLSDSRTITREYSAMASTRSVD